MRTSSRLGSHAGLQQAASGSGSHPGHGRVYMGIYKCWRAGSLHACPYGHASRSTYQGSRIPRNSSSDDSSPQANALECCGGMLKPALSQFLPRIASTVHGQTRSGTHLLPVQSVLQATRMAVHRSKQPFGAVTPSWTVQSGSARVCVTHACRLQRINPCTVLQCTPPGALQVT